MLAILFGNASTHRGRDSIRHVTRYPPCDLLQRGAQTSHQRMPASPQWKSLVQAVNNLRVNTAMTVEVPHRNVPQMTSAAVTRQFQFSRTARFEKS